MTESIALHLLRHADAGDPDAWQGDDAERPLSDRGVSQAESLAGHLARIRFAADVILTSPKVRAVQTANIVAGAVGAEVRVEERLVGPLRLGSARRLLRDAGEPRRPVLVGHDPDLSDLVAKLTGARDVRL